MPYTESSSFNHEQQIQYGNLTEFFGAAERQRPLAARRLANVVTGLIGTEKTEEEMNPRKKQEKLEKDLGDAKVGLAILDDWIYDMCAERFNVRLSLVESGKKKGAIALGLVKLPTYEELINVDGRPSGELYEQIITSLLPMFSARMKKALECGLTPKQILGGLVYESVGSKLSSEGSPLLRQALQKPLRGNFAMLRDALGIPDVAETSGFRVAESAVRKDKPVFAPVPKPPAPSRAIQFGPPDELPANSSPQPDERIRFGGTDTTDLLEQLIMIDEHKSDRSFEAGEVMIQILEDLVYMTDAERREFVGACLGKELNFVTDIDMAQTYANLIQTGVDRHAHLGFTLKTYKLPLEVATNALESIAALQARPLSSPQQQWEGIGTNLKILITSFGAMSQADRETLASAMYEGRGLLPEIAVAQLYADTVQTAIDAKATF